MRRSMRWEAPSMPISAHDPGLLREQETPLVIGKNWFLDQEIPVGGFVRIQDSSQVWQERVDETRIITTEGLTTCLDPGRGLTIPSGGWNFLKKQKCWEGHEQPLIITIRKETKRICPSFLSVGGTKRSTLLGGKRRTNGSNMGEPIRTRQGKLVGRVEHNARLGRVVQVKKRGGGNPLI